MTICKNGLNRNQLKYLAITAMVFDHVGMFFIPVTIPIGCIFRIIGRLTAPIMCFFIAEGYFYTHSKKKYGTRLFVFACISQFAYSFAHDQQLFTFDLNMIYTLFLSFLVLLSYDKIENKALKWISVAALIALTLPGDWGVIAPLWVLLFWIYRDRPKQKLIAYSSVAALTVFSDIAFLLMKGFHWYGELWQLGLFLAIPVLMTYNGKNGKSDRFSKWIFYIFYPLHLLIIGIIQMSLA